MFSILRSTSSLRSGQGVLFRGLILIWITAAVTGTTLLARYATTPGIAGDTPREWPAEISLPATANGMHVLMFAHPKCPCTRASLKELNRVMDRYDASATVIFWQPESSSDDVQWSDTELIQLARSFPTLHVVTDPGGVITHRFDAQTSGLCLAFDAAGSLQFRGGVTVSRGHEGVSSGQNKLGQFLASHDDGTDSTLPGSVLTSTQRPLLEIEEFPVFGCAIDPSR